MFPKKARMRIFSLFPGVSSDDLVFSKYLRD
jgi:hypothetical protein